MQNAQSTSLSELSSLNQVLLTTLDETVFFGSLLAFFKEKLNCDRIAIYRTFEDTSVSLVADSSIIEIKSEIIEKGKSLAGYVAKTRRSYYGNNVQRDPLYTSFAGNEGVIAELAMPIICEGLVLATIHLQSKNAEVKFSDADLEMIKSILNSLQKPLVNMKMYISAKNLNESLSRKILEKEQELQNKLNSSLDMSFEKITERPIIGNSQAVKNIIELAHRVAKTDTNIMILGETGTGKEAIARKIHCQSDRAQGAYYIVNCGALQDNLLESELFGHMKGSFNGAISDKIGLIEKADNGTIFLDEVSSLNPMMQTKILRFLQEGEAYRVGGTSTFKSNVRIISATNKDLKKEVDEGRFREDFYYRLNTIAINTPKLSERVEDISTLANYFLKSDDETKITKSLTPGAIKVLSDYSWPGNIRELQNIIERADIMCDGQFIEASHLPEHLKVKKTVEPEAKVYREMTLDSLEKEHICSTLVHLKGNKTKTARVLGITVKTLYNKLHSYGMIQPQNKDS